MTVDPDLQEAIHKLLISFVDICACCVEVLGDSKWQKFKIVAKTVLFDDDSGVKGELNNFRALVARQSRITDAITLEHVLKSQHSSQNSHKVLFTYLKNQSERTGQQLDVLQQSVGRVEEAMKGRRDADISAQTRELLNSLSSIDPSIYLNEARNTQVSGTGDWFLESSEFQHWLNGPRKLVLLHGVAGSGKTVLR